MGCNTDDVLLYHCINDSFSAVRRVGISFFLEDRQGTAAGEDVPCFFSVLKPTSTGVNTLSARAFDNTRADAR
jgi:hypothetical protein